MIDLSLADTWLYAALCVSIRFGVVLMAPPFFRSFNVPRTFRVVFVIALSYCLLAATGAPPPVPQTLSGLLAAICGELLLGALLAFGLECMFAAFQFGGRLIDSQIGFGIANLFDPVTRAQAPLLGVALNLLAMALFFALDMHHQVVRGLVWSIQMAPPGLAHPVLDPDLIGRQFGTLIVSGVSMVAAVMVLMLLIDIGMAAISRTMPQMNVFVASLPVKALAGLVLLSLTVSSAVPLLRNALTGVLRFWEALLG